MTALVIIAVCVVAVLLALGAGGLFITAAAVRLLFAVLAVALLVALFGASRRF